MRVFSADNFGGNTFAFGYHGEYFQDSDTPFQGDNEFYRQRLGLNYGLTKYLEFFVEGVSTVNNTTNSTTPYGYYGYDNEETYLSIGDINAGGKITLPLAKAFKLAVEGSVQTYSDFEGNNFEGTSYGIRGLATLNLGAMMFNGTPVLAHFNYQYLYNNSYDIIEKTGNYAYRYLGITQYDRMNYGAALELQAGIFNPFIEWTLSQPLSSKIEIEEYPNVITLGAKFNPGEERRLSLNAGVDFGLTQYNTYDLERTPQYSFVFGLAYILGGQRTGKPLPQPVAMSNSNDMSSGVAKDAEATNKIKQQILEGETTPEGMKGPIREEVEQEYALKSDEQDMSNRIDMAYEVDEDVKEELSVEYPETESKSELVSSKNVNDKDTVSVKESINVSTDDDIEFETKVKFKKKNNKESYAKKATKNLPGSKKSSSVVSEDLVSEIEEKAKEKKKNAETVPVEDLEEEFFKEIDAEEE
jgi:hypothetical protein